MLQVADSVSSDSVDGTHTIEGAEPWAPSLLTVNGPVTTRGASKVGPAQVLDVIFMHNMDGQVTALMIGTDPAALAPVVGLVNALKA